MVRRAEHERAAHSNRRARRGPIRATVAVAAATLVILTSIGCGGGATPAPKTTNKPTASAAGSAEKSAASPGTPKPSPTPDPAGRAQPAAGECPQSHLIKGATLPTGERLYYEPDRPTYATVTPEVCFTAGGDARANGYQEARR